MLPLTAGQRGRKICCSTCEGLAKIMIPAADVAFIQSLVRRTVSVGQSDSAVGASSLHQDDVISRLSSHGIPS